MHRHRAVLQLDGGGDYTVAVNLSPCLQPVPAPWILHGDAHVLLAWLPAEALPVPRGVSHLQRPRRSLGGVGALAFIRYAASDVGAYDELLWLTPFGLSEHGQHMHSVTHIFVSSEASEISGRANWGIPKQRAEFDVTQPAPGTQHVTVWSATGRIASFEVATRPRSLHADTKTLPRSLMTLGQVLDSRLFIVTPRVRGRLHRARFTNVEAAEERFVNLRRARPLGAFTLSAFEMRFPAADVRAL